MSLSQRNNFYALEWHEAKPHLMEALNGYDPSAEIKAGVAFPFFIDGAYTLVRTEAFEMVVIAFQGSHKLETACAFFYDLAKAIKAKSIRLHTKRSGFLPFVQSIGYPFELAEKNGREYILRLVI
ncbi:hypothetical protein L9W97_01860 [Vibrio aestuarianus]|uniref:hypothetical protein n=1 Tax=Vibrio aestuarianus TaxID=28171 RepID=UPI00237C672C|nr:hypothetical protein [Vibrio aestuarianus]MDE1323865.1 hypothetical protein [Vibrio aestuarianus]